MTNGNFVFDIDGAIAIAVSYQPEKIEEAVTIKYPKRRKRMIFNPFSCGIKHKISF